MQALCVRLLRLVDAARKISGNFSVTYEVALLNPKCQSGLNYPSLHSVSIFFLYLCSCIFNMLSLTFTSYLLFGLTVATCSHRTHLQRHVDEPAFGYDVSKGPLTWYKLSDNNTACRGGRNQSPIDIGTDNRPSLFQLSDGTERVQAGTSARPTGASQSTMTNVWMGCSRTWELRLKLLRTAKKTRISALLLVVRSTILSSFTFTHHQSIVSTVRRFPWKCIWSTSHQVIAFHSCI